LKLRKDYHSVQYLVVNVFSVLEVKAADSDVTDNDLSELEKYWKSVKENPSDFTGWTYLLQYVEQEVS
jgi:hypothetical protein